LARISPVRIAGIEKIGRDFRAFVVGTPEFTYFEIDKDSWLDPIGRDYYLDRKVMYFSPTDQEGIPLVVRGPGESPFYRPTRVASFGLANWNRYRQQGSEDCRSAFMKCAEWFMKFEEGRFVYRYDMLDLKAPWMAGIAQGQGISLLTRAYLLTRNPGFLAQAQKALLPFPLRYLLNELGFPGNSVITSPQFLPYPKTGSRGADLGHRHTSFTAK
jgi:heparosan-N-sulfate-glucuronate 5-epimerase